MDLWIVRTIVVARRARDNHLVSYGLAFLRTVPDVLPGLRLRRGLRIAAVVYGGEEVLSGYRESRDRRG